MATRFLGALIILFLTTSLLIAEAPPLRCVFVIPDDEQPFPDAKERLTTALKDIQWWYSCQMEAHGYGPKTFALELDEKGQVRIWMARMRTRAYGDKMEALNATIAAAKKKMGHRWNKPNAIFVVVYGGYHWKDKEKLIQWPLGMGAKGKWAHFSGYHYFNICPAGWRIATPLAEFADPDGLFPKEHLQMLKAYYGSQRIKEMPHRIRLPMALQCDGHGIFAHELGHAFGLSHRKLGDAPVKMDVMNIGVFGVMRGNFLEDIQGEYCCLSPKEASILNKNPVFRPIRGLESSTGAPRSVGARGVKEAIEAHREFLKGSKNLDSSILIGSWMLKTNNKRVITFNRDGTVLANYDSDKGRRWHREGNDFVFTNAKGETQAIIFLEGENAIKMGTNTWIKKTETR